MAERHRIFLGFRAGAIICSGLPAVMLGNLIIALRGCVKIFGDIQAIETIPNGEQETWIGEHTWSLEMLQA